MDNNNNYTNNPGQFSPPPDGYDVRPPYYKNDEMTVKDWVIVSILLAIPCVNIIMLIVWAFSGSNETRSNFAKGYLIAGAIVLLVSVILSFIFAAYITAFFVPFQNFL